jgi:hypothetical protein
VTQPQDPVLYQTITAVSGAAAITQAVSDSTTRVIQALWRSVNPYDRKSVSEFSKRAGQLIIASQRTVANAHTASQLLQLRAVGINQNVAVTIPDNVRGATAELPKPSSKVTAPAKTTIDYQDGPQTVTHSESTPDRLFERAAEKYRYEISTGKDHAQANDLAEQRIESLVDNNMILSARLASQQTLLRVAGKDERILGYRRVIHPELSKGGVCGMCVAAANRKYKISELQPIHARCKCTISPITTAHDPGLRMNDADLEKLYAHAEDATGGTVRSTSAEALKRTRYQIVHHHELGPVLTQAGPLDYGSQAA